MDNIQNLLQQIGTIRKKNAEILEASGGQFNIFDVCDVKSDENKNSAIIAAFLNPQGAHGLKHKFLECFIETLGGDFTIGNFNCEKAQVRTEPWIDNGRLDILISDNQNKAIIIENKIYAGDQINQLQKYDSHAKGKYGERNYQILYLTLGGNEASDDSGKGVNYLRISYSETIINWLERCVAISVRFPMVRETIIQYINHLKKLTNQDMDTKNKEEIVDMIVANHDFFESAEYIHDVLIECKKKICKKVETEIKKAADELGLKPDRDYKDIGNTDRGIRIHLKKDNWDFSIGIPFFGTSAKEGGKGHFGLVIGLAYYGCPSDTREKLLKIVNDLLKRDDGEIAVFDEVWDSCWAKANKRIEEENLIYKNESTIKSYFYKIRTNPVFRQTEMKNF